MKRLHKRTLLWKDRATELIVAPSSATTSRVTRSWISLSSYGRKGRELTKIWREEDGSRLEKKEKETVSSPLLSEQKRKHFSLTLKTLRPRVHLPAEPSPMNPKAQTGTTSLSVLLAPPRQVVSSSEPIRRRRFPDVSPPPRALRQLIMNAKRVKESDWTCSEELLREEEGTHSSHDNACRKPRPPADCTDTSHIHSETFHR